MSVCAECCEVEISATGLSLVQRSPTKCGVSECDYEPWITRRLLPTGLLHHGKKNTCSQMQDCV
jgi:hypothetical protein